MTSKAATDCIQRFTFVDTPVRGQWVRLEGVLSEANRNQHYPSNISAVLAQMFAAVSLFADNLKFSGAVALQSQGSGKLIRSLAECRDRAYLRGIAHLNNDVDTPAADTLNDWLQEGRLALTLIPPADSEQQTYQGLVDLSSPTLAENLENYFASSEQLPTRLYFAYQPGRVTGLLLQRLPGADHATEIDQEQADEHWRTVQMLADTVTESELANLDADALIRRLFNEYACRLFPSRELSYRCTCNRQKTDNTLSILSPEELIELVETQGEIYVDCEFCGTRYRYDRVDVAALLKRQGGPAYEPNPTVH